MRRTRTGETLIHRRHRSFRECYDRLDEQTRRRARAAFIKLLNDPSHPSLHLERLLTDSRLWSVRVDRDHRAVAVRAPEKYLWIWIGDHEEFDQLFPR